MFIYFPYLLMTLRFVVYVSATWFFSLAVISWHFYKASDVHLTQPFFTHNYLFSGSTLSFPPVKTPLWNICHVRKSVYIQINTMDAIVPFPGTLDDNHQIIWFSKMIITIHYSLATLFHISFSHILYIPILYIPIDKNTQQ